MTESAAREPVLTVTGGGKRYKGVLAIDGVDFSVLPGEVHALVGENGAGKSTLCKAICGAIVLDEGELRVNGEDVQFKAPHDGLKQGIAMVYQETSLVPTMTVAQNMELGRERLFTRLRSLNIGAQQLLQSMNFRVDPATYVSELGSAKKQMVEIARALKWGARLVIFDEPTATLTPEETMHLFQVIDDLKKSDIGVIFVSHALEETLQIADRVTVLRDGRLQTTSPIENMTKADLISHMVGREVGSLPPRRPREAGVKPRKVLRVENLTMGTTVKNMSFSAYAGEVLGIAGLIGSGRTETAKIISGSMKRNRIHGGTVLLNGKRARYRVPRQAIDDGIVYVTEDRKREGTFELMSIARNLYLGSLSTRGNRKALLSRSTELRTVEPWIKRLSIRSISPRARLVELSGGNQQKVVIAKSLIQNPDVVILDEPTRGVDVASIAEIRAMIRAIADEGKTVIVISSYLPEILAVSDRILVARQGRIAAEFSPEEATEEKIMYAAVH